MTKRQSPLVENSPICHIELVNVHSYIRYLCSYLSNPNGWTIWLVGRVMGEPIFFTWMSFKDMNEEETIIFYHFILFFWCIQERESSSTTQIPLFWQSMKQQMNSVMLSITVFSRILHFENPLRNKRIYKHLCDLILGVDQFRAINFQLHLFARTNYHPWYYFF